MNIDSKLREILFQAFEVGVHNGRVQHIEGEAYPLHEDAKIAAIHKLINELVFSQVLPCKEHCTPKEHAYHQGQWDMMERIKAATGIKEESNHNE